MSGGNGQAGGGQLNGTQIQQALGQMQGFNPYGNVDNRIVDARQSPGLLQNSAQMALESQAKWGANGGGMPMPMGDAQNPALQHLQGLLAATKDKKMAALKMIAGG